MWDRSIVKLAYDQLYQNLKTEREKAEKDRSKYKEKLKPKKIRTSIILLYSEFQNGRHIQHKEDQTKQSSWMHMNVIITNRGIIE